MTEPSYEITPKLVAALDQVVAAISNGNHSEAQAMLADITGSEDLSDQLQFVAIISAIEKGYHAPSQIEIFVVGYIEALAQAQTAKVLGLGGPLA